jgi:hypothetical protein
MQHNTDPTAQSLVERLRIRAAIRRTIPGRRAQLLGQADRLADLLDEAAAEIDRLTSLLNNSTL